LQWDRTLTNVARQWATSCPSGASGTRHSSPDWRQNRYVGISGTQPPGGSIGENLAYGPEMAGKDALGYAQLWFDEKHDYDCRSDRCIRSICGHYRQAVWEETTHIGCYLNECSSQDIFLVCMYAKWGNQMAPERPFSPSQCPAGGFSRRPPPPPLNWPTDRQPTGSGSEWQPVERQPVEREPVQRQPVERQPVGNGGWQPVGNGGWQPVERQPVGNGGWQPVGNGGWQPVERQPVGNGGWQPVGNGGWQPVERQPVSNGGWQPVGNGGWQPVGQPVGGGWQPVGNGGWQPVGNGGWQPVGNGGNWAVDSDATNFDSTSPNTLDNVGVIVAVVVAVVLTVVLVVITVVLVLKVRKQ